ncbi:MAG: DUF5946 family protein [Solirubrobacteraceae bacterium MAG38_C4-C5]|nr:DUF5946 family protein [Candidatus Siliceabacter maunaloa]
MAAQYSDPERMAFHQLIVDTYAVQHPDGDEPRAIQSVAIHLKTLCSSVASIRRLEPSCTAGWSIAQSSTALTLQRLAER